jgi:hypothetical protein
MNIAFQNVGNELPRRKQRGITKNFDYELRKRRGTFGPSDP